MTQTKQCYNMQNRTEVPANVTELFLLRFWSTVESCPQMFQIYLKHTNQILKYFLFNSLGFFTVIIFNIHACFSV